MSAAKLDRFDAAVAAYFADIAKSEVISADQLTELISTFTGRTFSAKTVRAHMRKMAQRDQSQYHGSTWRITQVIAVSELRYFARNMQSES